MPSVARNTTFLTASFVLQKVLAFIYFTLIARLTGVSFTGSYVFALSFTTMFSVFVDMGLSSVLIREVARNREKSKEYLNNILGLKILLAIVSFLAIVLTITLIEPNLIVRIMVYIAGILMVSDSFVLTFWSVFRGFQDLRFEALGIVFSQVITFTVGLGGLLFGYPLYILIVALLLGSLFNLGFSLILIFKKLGMRPKLRISKSVLKALFAIALPFALLQIFTRLLFSVDVVMLKKLTTASYVGWYSVAHKITFAFQFLPSAFAASLFPAMSQAFIENKERLAMLFEKSMRYLIIIAIPLSTGIMLLAKDIILHIYTKEFEPSILALQIIVWSSMLLFLSFPIGALLNATDNHIRNAIHIGISVMLMIVLNAVLIPKFQHVGAAISSVGTWITLLALNFWYSRKIIDIHLGKLFIFISKSVLASFIMGLVVWGLKSLQPLGLIGVLYTLVFIPIFGAIVYITLAFIFRLITIQEVKMLKSRILHN